MNTKWAPTELRATWRFGETEKSTVTGPFQQLWREGSLGDGGKEHWVTLWGSDGHHEAA